VAAAAPLALLLAELGWTRALAMASSLGVVSMVGVLVLVKDSPYARSGPARIKLRALAGSLRTVWGNPGTRLGMWSHFTSQFSVTVFALLWGYPFLVSRFPYYRSYMVIGVVVVMAVLWAVVLLRDTPSPGWLLVVLDLREPGGVTSYDLDDFRVALRVQFGFWTFGVAQILRNRRKGLDQLRRLHPGAVEAMRRGVPFVHPGIGDREGV